MNENDSWRIYRTLQPGEQIVIGADTAAGGGDYCAAQFLSVNRRDVPLVYHSPLTATEMTPQIVRMMNSIYFDTGVKPIIAYERNNGGVFEIERLRRNNKGNYELYQMKNSSATIVGEQSSPKYGWDTNSATRPPMLLDLKDAIDHQLITIYDQPTINEMLSFVEIQTPTSWKPQAEEGSHDDLIMALAIAWQLYQTASLPRENSAVINNEIDDRLRDSKPAYVNESGELVNSGLGDIIGRAVKESTKPKWR